MAKPASRNTLEHKLAATLAKREAASRLRRLTVPPADSADFSSNSYLSISGIPEVREAYVKSLESFLSAPRTISAPLGSGGSRLLDGNSEQAETLESDLARFYNAGAGLLFNSGFDANVSLFGSVPQPGDIIVYDELIHASAHDGMRQSRAGKKVAFKHNCVLEGAEGSTSRGEKLGCLDRVLQELLHSRGGEAAANGEGTVFVAVEGVYSMDGDVAPLEEIVACVKRRLPRGNGRLIVDEAHSTGLFGREGRGLVCELGLEDDVFARLHTFGKAMGCSGAVVLCAPVVRQYLINYARPLIYSTAMSAASLSAIRVSFDYVASGKAEPLRAQLRKLTRYAHDLLLTVCSDHRAPPELLHLAPETPWSPIMPLFTARPRSLSKHCQSRGLMVRPVVAPTVPKGSERVRICIHASNSEAEIERLAGAVSEWLEMQLREKEKVASVIARHRTGSRL